MRAVSLSARLRTAPWRVSKHRKFALTALEHSKGVRRLNPAIGFPIIVNAGGLGARAASRAIMFRQANRAKAPTGKIFRR